MMKGETLRLGGAGPAGLRGRRGNAGTTCVSSVVLASSPPFPPKPEASPPKAKPTPPRKKGPRPKHVPQRMCIACRERDTKRGLHRIVRTPEGMVEPDPTGRRNGRGAYLCEQAACWEKALATGLLARALNVTINNETIEALRRHAATLPLASSATGTAREQGGER
jgi:predicted RNA-binding protein YlxR (DUF448 family)